MNILDRAKRDIKNITSNTGDFAVEITFIAPDSTTVTITGLHTKIYLNVDEMGNPISSKKAHISVSEKSLTDLDYPVRNTKGEVNLVKHRVNVKDSTGIEKNYITQIILPNETVGLITIILEDYASE